MDYSLLPVSPLFRNIPPEEIGQILSSLPHKIRKYKAGTLIAQSGEEVRSMLIVTTGTAKGEMIDFAGRMIKIEDIPAPGALAAAFMFGNNSRFPVNVIAVTDTELLVIEKSDFLKLLKRNEKILVNYLDMISNRSQFLSGKIKFLSFKTIRQKLAQYILESAGNDKTETRLGMTQNELADYFGVARPSIGRAISELENEGLILTKGRNIKILNKEKLSDLTKE
ncbi:MAG: Crp/Fnr family transcriptional regulator [Bacteroidota bacterium]|nr:Crp/Fnr family transcriptional regulator [Bacteroidota bacterium]